MALLAVLLLSAQFITSVHAHEEHEHEEHHSQETCSICFAAASIEAASNKLNGCSISLPHGNNANISLPRFYFSNAKKEAFLARAPPHLA